MIHKIAKLIIILIIILVSGISFVFAEEESQDPLNQSESEPEQTGLEESRTPTLSDVQSKLDLLEESTPVILRIYDTRNLISGSEIKVKARVGLFKQADSRELHFKWELKKDGLAEEIAASKQGKGKDQFSFTPVSSGNYELKVQATDSAGGIKESLVLAIPIGDNLMVDFNPLKPVNGQRVLINAAVFDNDAVYKWYLDGQEQETTGSSFEFIVNKNFKQTHKIKVMTSNKQGIVSTKEILIPVYRPEVVLKPAFEGLTAAGQAGSSREFLVKGEGLVTLNAGEINFMDADQANYIWYLDNRKIDEGIGKKSIFIDTKDKQLKQNRNGEHRVSVMVASPDLKHIAESEITMNQLDPNSSLASANPEKISNKSLRAESKDFIASLSIMRKLILPIMVVIFLVLIALGNTQPQKIE